MLVREVMMLQDIGPELVNEDVPTLFVSHNVNLCWGLLRVRINANHSRVYEFTISPLYHLGDISQSTKLVLAL